jgi:hypothetical protein
MCPKCKGTDLEYGLKNTSLTYQHVKCKSCGTVGWVATETHFDEHGYCGSPVEHWKISMDPERDDSLESVGQGGGRK